MAVKTSWYCAEMEHHMVKVPAYCACGAPVCMAHLEDHIDSCAYANSVSDFDLPLWMHGYPMNVTLLLVRMIRKARRDSLEGTRAAWYCAESEHYSTTIPAYCACGAPVCEECIPSHVNSCESAKTLTDFELPPNGLLSLAVESGLNITDWPFPSPYDR